MVAYLNITKTIPSKMRINIKPLIYLLITTYVGMYLTYLANYA